MATVARQERYQQKRADVARKLRERGSIEKFGVRKKGASRANPDHAFVELFESPVFPLDWDEDFSNDVRADDLMFMVGADDDLSDCRIMLFGGYEHVIKKIKPFKIDGITIYFEIQVRG